jgi:hypothetical protein
MFYNDGFMSPMRVVVDSTTNSEDPKKYLHVKYTKNDGSATYDIEWEQVSSFSNYEQPTAMSCSTSSSDYSDSAYMYFDMQWAKDLVG